MIQYVQFMENAGVALLTVGEVKKAKVGLSAHLVHPHHGCI